jgi:hypothetical protein
VTIGIYCITEISTGLCYIGQSKCIERRWRDHQKVRFPLHRFKHEVLMQCPEEDLNRYEVDFISRWDSHRNGFNKTIGGTSIKATHPDAETLQKMSASMKGQPKSDEHRAKMSAVHKGKTLSDETRAKMSASAKVKSFSLEHRAKLSAAARNCSDETRAKLSAAAKESHRLKREVAAT